MAGEQRLFARRNMNNNSNIIVVQDYPLSLYAHDWFLYLLYKVA